MRLFILIAALLLAGCGDDECGIEGDFCMTRWDCCDDLKCKNSIEFTGGRLVVVSECRATE